MSKCLQDELIVKNAVRNLTSAATCFSIPPCELLMQNVFRLVLLFKLFQVGFAFLFFCYSRVVQLMAPVLSTSGSFPFEWPFALAHTYLNTYVIRNFEIQNYLFDLRFYLKNLHCRILGTDGCSSTLFYAQQQNHSNVRVVVCRQ